MSKVNENELNIELEKSYNSIRQTILDGQTKVIKQVNQTIIQVYHQVGKEINDIIGDNKRSKYGDAVIENISKRLLKEFGKGFDRTNLIRMKNFYQMVKISDALCHQLTWSHYRIILKIKNEQIRNFYIEECASCNWSTRQLERQINSMYYQRLLASKNKNDVREEINNLESKDEYMNIIKDPYILEFLNIEPNSKYYEKDLETALINNIQKFLLELGRGFCFEARQKMFKLEDDYFYIDLVFYNYILKCHVLIDLKINKITHQDLGQMQMYVNYYKREIKKETDNPPIGIVLCADKNDLVVKYTLPEGNNQIFASKYMTCLPTEEELLNEIKILKINTK